MTPKRIFTTQHVAKLAKQALQQHGPNLTVRNLTHLTSLSPPTLIPDP